MDRKGEMEDSDESGKDQGDGETLVAADGHGAAEGRSIRQLSNVTVMMVDDDPVVTEVISAYLEEAGYARVISTNEPGEAMAMVRRERPDLILLDLMMPVVSGFDILRELREDAELRYLPVIVLTASTDARTKLRALELGCTEYLAKPVDQSELVLRVRNSLAFKAYQDRLANSDMLTGLPNRRIFLKRLEAAMRGASGNDRTLALLHVDLDRFKRINDTLGQNAGDRVLQEVARRLEQSTRAASDLVTRVSGRAFGMLARLGGDEYIVLLDDLAQVDDAALVARRVIEEIARPIAIAKDEVYVTASIGIAVFPGDGAEVEDLLKNAEVAMYKAKDKGRDRYDYYSRDLNARAAERLSLENQLRRVIENGELALYYQPKVDIATGRIVGAEGLLRWHHPERGLVQPGMMIPIAEDSGLIVPIGEWVLYEACRQLAEWAQNGLAGLKLSINVARQQMVDGRFSSALRRALSVTPIDPARLVIELTETQFFDKLVSDRNAMAELKSLGVGLSIDDFGTGYSALSYLKHLPIDELKIDRSFVTGIHEDRADLAIVRTIITLAQNLGLGVIAEGVETEGQLATLRGLGCDQYQGYLCSRPVPAGEFTNLIALRHGTAG